MDEKLTLREKLKLKVDEALNHEGDKLNPYAAERVNQIVNDAVVSMPPPEETATAAEKPEVALARKVKEQLDAAVAANVIPKELAKKIEGIVTSVETAPKTDKSVVTPAAPAAAPASAPKR
jgi:hypothetical protein